MGAPGGGNRWSVIETGTSRGERRRFLRAGLDIYEHDARRVQPLWSDWLRHTDPERNPFFEHAGVAHFVLRRDGRDRGRIAAIHNRRSEQFRRDRTGWFGWFECPNDGEAASILVDAATSWLRDRGCDAVLGPASYSTNDECGVLVDGFDGPPVLMMPWNPPWYDTLLKECGLAPAEDLLAWDLRAGDIATDRFRRIVERSRKRHGWSIRTLRVNRFDEEMALLRDLYNRAWEANWGFVPMSEKEFAFAADSFRPVIVPELVLVAEHEGRPVGFALSLPDMNEVLIHLGGKLLPFGWWKAWRLMKRIRRVRVMALGVLPEFRGKGVDAGLYVATMDACVALKMPGGECSWTLERNTAVNGAMESLGARPYRRYRLYGMGL